MSWRTDIADQLASSTSAGEYARVYCPACPSRVGKTDRSKSCSVSRVTGWWLCHRCGYRGRLDGYDDQDQLTSLDEPTDLEQPSDYVEVTPERVDALPAAVAYLAQRRVHPSLWARTLIGYARTGLHTGRLILPLVHTPDWRTVGWVGRLLREPFGPWEPRYHTSGGLDRATAFWNADALTTPDHRPVIVTEGAFDALRLYPHAVACLGKPTAGQLATLARCARPLVFALDGDAWQYSLAHALQLRAAGKRAWALALPHGLDPDTHPPRQLLTAARYADAHSTDLDLASWPATQAAELVAGGL